MTNATPDYLNCSPEIVGGLIETASDALLQTFPKVSVDPYDIELMLDALRVLRPKVPEIQMLDGILHMVRNHWDDAILVLREVSESAPRFAYAKALLAFCLSTKGDADWKMVANEVLEGNPTRDTVSLVKALHAREELVNAVQASRNGSTFITPASVDELNEELAARGDKPDVAPVSQPPSAGIESLPFGVALRA
ncbi:HrpB1 family type III secretion system apparatus protein [Burkholderia perseverans]|uniref:HrpB1 family type III secretion system apparatus protein n=1 Tax=Burkholderia perseverans TaxID=2615214 RepID=UPI001FEDD2ED|nr:HrpB1 family type III secretion system apparatus protein [Burkholderia perseverans]